MFTVIKEHPALVKYAVSLQAKNSAALGFLPRCVFEDRARQGRIFLGLLDGDPAGYCMANAGWQGILRCHQIAIEYDTRRRLYGAMLMQAVEDYGMEIGCTSVTLRCGAELPANEFWQSLGYQVEGTVKSGSRFSHLNVWAKALSPSWIATEWNTGRPRIYMTNAERQAAYRSRRASVTSQSTE